MEWITHPGVTFIAGAIVSAAVAALIARFFERPRLHFAVTDLSTTCEREDASRRFSLAPELRDLLSRRPSKHIDWEAREPYFSANELQLAYLETFDREHRYRLAQKRLETFLHELTYKDVGDVVYSFACDKELLGLARSALVQYEAQAPAAPKAAPGKPRFPLLTVQNDKRTEIMLDLPGNAAPEVSHPSGLPELNKKVQVLAYALSYADTDPLASIMKLGVDYVKEITLVLHQIREHLLKLKNDHRFLTLDVMIANLGKEPALLSQSAKLVLDTRSRDVDQPASVISLRQVDRDGDRTSSVDRQLITTAANLAHLYSLNGDELKGFEPAITYIPVSAGQTLRLHFVSASALSPAELTLVDAIKNGFVDCELSLTQHLPKLLGLYPRLPLYRKRITRRQRLDGRGIVVQS